MVTDDVHRSYEEIAKNYTVTYVAGGASQNAARGAAVSILTIVRSTDLNAPFLVRPPSQVGGVHGLCR